MEQNFTENGQEKIATDDPLLHGFRQLDGRKYFAPQCLKIIKKCLIFNYSLSKWLKSQEHPSKI